VRGEAQLQVHLLHLARLYVQVLKHIVAAQQKYKQERTQHMHQSYVTTLHQQALRARSARGNIWEGQTCAARQPDCGQPARSAAASAAAAGDLAAVGKAAAPAEIKVSSSGAGSMHVTLLLLHACEAMPQ
jgi:hypothetical protein